MGNHQKLSGIIVFFSDPVVARQIGGYILDRQPIARSKFNARR
jgi:hypothetical protein